MTIDNVNDILDKLIDKAELDCKIACAKAESYKEGYVDGCESFGKRLRHTIYEERKNN